jgi:hypothetical protein
MHNKPWRKLRAAGPSKRPAVLAALLVLIAALALWPANGFAATGQARFIFEMCDSQLPNGGAGGVSFSVNPGVPFVPINTCSQPGGSLGIQETGHVSATYSFLSVPVAATPGGWTERISISAASCGGAGTTAFAMNQGWPLLCQPEQDTTFEGKGSVGSVWLFLGCDGNYSPGCEAGPWVSAHYFAALEVDPVAPKVSATGGSLVGGGVIHGHATIEGNASDEGGGLSKLFVKINGFPAGTVRTPSCNVVNANNPSVKGIVAATVTPCPTGLEGQWTLDTQAYPFHDGSNAVELCADDFSTIGAPNETCSPPQSIDVDNSCPNSLAAGGESLKAVFKRSDRQRITVGYGRPAKLVGKLTDSNGQPVSGAAVCIEGRTLEVGLTTHPLQTVITDARGHYSYKLKPGPNRELMVGYRQDARQVEQHLRYFSRVKPRFYVDRSHARNGQRVRLFGRLPGPRARGTVVVLQGGVVGGSRWLTFRKATAGKRGWFSAWYIFRNTFRRTVYRLRALVPRQAGYPRAEGHSDAANVVVTR